MARRGAPRAQLWIWTTCADIEHGTRELALPVDDLTYAARRASATLARPDNPADLETRFKNLVQSPLRAGILRYLSARPEESFDVESLMTTFGRLKLDIDNSHNELVEFGVAPPHPRPPSRDAAMLCRRALRPAASPAARHISRAARRNQHGGPVSLRPALP